MRLDIAKARGRIQHIIEILVPPEITCIKNCHSVEAPLFSEQTGIAGNNFRGIAPVRDHFDAFGGKLVMLHQMIAHATSENDDPCG